jgi:UDP-hydrolysing UDP-N-acetyl-D-glucosamine 2-epimerase
MRTIAAVTVGRSDFGIYRPVLQSIRDDPQLVLRLIVSGAHLSPEFGWTVREIEQDGFQADERVDMLLSADTPAAISASMGVGMIGFSQALQRLAPDVLLVLGDRYEMLAAAAAAVPFRIPIAHIHGGEVTRGAIDDSFRHAITKFSHLHFVATSEYADRVVQLGEEPWRVTVSGAPALDNLQSLPPLTREELQQRLRLRLDQPPILVTFHPVTLQYEQAEPQVRELLAALESQTAPIILTQPNADTNGRIIIRLLKEFAARHPRAQLIDSLGTRAWFSLMRHAAVMVGNSSSGIIEAASFELPVVNVGARQEGRTRSGNVIDVGNHRDEIRAGISKALDPAFRRRLRGLRNAYSRGSAAEIIVRRLKEAPLDDMLLQKRFHDLRPGPEQRPVWSDAA